MDSTFWGIVVTAVFGLFGVIFGRSKGMSRQQRSELVTSDAKWRVMEDYALSCRQRDIDAGRTPLPWPKELRHIGPGEEDDSE